MSKVKNQKPTMKPEPKRDANISIAKQGLKLGSKNWMFIGAGIACIAVGFFLLNLKALVLATLLLVVGYCVLIPMGIMIKVKQKA